MMRRIRCVLLMLLVASLSLQLFGCGGKQENSSQSKSTPSQTAPSSTFEQGTVPSESDPYETDFPDSAPDSVEDDPFAQMESANLQYPSQNDTWKYNVYDCYIEISGYIGPEGDDAIVPAEIDGLPVWKIGQAALSKAKIKSIQLPDCLKQIDAVAFKKSEVETITMPQNLDAIGTRAFWDCMALTKIIIPQGINGIAEEAFCGCKNLSEVILPEGLTFIDSGAFSGCENLINITIPESVTYIGELAFYECSSLQSIHVPAGVTVINHGTFLKCTNLSQVQLEEGVEHILDGAFGYCRSLESLVLPASVSGIGTNQWNTPPFSDVADNFDLTILNPDITLYDYLFDQYSDENKVIYGYAGSTAAEYCANHNITFQLIE